MYLRRHCYNKARRCPGWAGPGWRGTFDDTKPDYWDTLLNEDGDYPWETSNSRRRHWWQRRDLCSNGYLWTMALQDPWRMFRSHRCTKCDVRTIPMFTHWFDPTWLWFHFSREIQYKFQNIAWHKNRWMDPPGPPWWSLPNAVWKELGWPAIKNWLASKAFYSKWWWKHFKVWVNPQTRELDRARAMEHYNLSE